MNKKRKVHICHLASAHKRNDTRIGAKMAASAHKHGLSVSFVVADGGRVEYSHGIKIVGVRKFKSRFKRILIAPLFVYRAAMLERAFIYHIHDPELLLLAPFAKFFTGGKYIYDAHEDLPQQIKTKPYLRQPWKSLLGMIASIILYFTLRTLDGVIGATPTITHKLSRYNKKAVTICNFPDLREFNNTSCEKQLRSSVSYVGNIGESRGIFETLRALELCKTDFQFELIGAFVEDDTFERAQAMQGWKRVTEYHGWVSRDLVVGGLQRTLVGLVNLRPHENYMDALPVKLFEYMAAGVPVVISNFPLWEAIVDESGCGVSIDPMNPQQIADAIDYYIENPTIAQEMGKAGKDAVKNKYNWQFEEAKLLNFYKCMEKKLS